jgi:uncharacterized damage-inducible protein DinB
MLKEIQELSEHMNWADATIWNAILQLPENKNQDKMRELLHHTHTVQNAYLNIWLKQPVKFRDINEFPGYNEIANWGLNFHIKLKKFLIELKEDNLQLIIDIPWTKSLEKNLGKPAEDSSLIQQLFQVFMHSTYHRGQVNKLIREAGGEPPLTDFIYWLWTGKPEEKWKSHKTRA